MEHIKQRKVKDNEILKKNKISNPKWKNNVNKIEIKDKTLRTQFFSIFLICDLRGEKTFKEQNFLNLKFEK